MEVTDIFAFRAPRWLANIATADHAAITMTRAVAGPTTWSSSLISCVRGQGVNLKPTGSTTLAKKYRRGLLLDSAFVWHDSRPSSNFLNLLG